MNANLLYVNWRSDTARRIFPVGRLLLRAEAPRWEFSYIEGSRDAEPCGFNPYPEFPDLDAVYRSDELFPLFQLRLMPESRVDFRSYIERLGLDPDQHSPLVVLARSGGRSTTDRIEFIAPPRFDVGSRRHIFYFFSRGIRYEPAAEPVIARLRPDDELRWSPEPENEHDPLAIALFPLNTDSDTLVGRVPFYLVEDFDELREVRADLRVFVERVNLPPAPVDQRLLCRLEARWSNGFVPFTTHRFASRSPAATVLPVPAAKQHS